MQHQKAIVVGLGASGLASVRYLVSQGWDITVLDTRECPPNLKVLQTEFPQIKFIGGDLENVQLDDESMLVLSPGISPYFSAIAPLVSSAKAREIDVVGEIELFARHLDKLKREKNYSPKVIGITGTNGKTTTTMLSAHIVSESGHSVCFAGNVGPNALAEVMRLEKQEKLPEYWVLELSSFQLETTSSLKCDAAALLNITEDHIDWHGSIAAYAAAKAKIFTKDTVRVLNRDDEVSISFAQGVNPALIRSFDLDAPAGKGEYGIEMLGSFPWLSCMDEEEEGINIIPANSLLIRGGHNKANALAAAALTMSTGIGLSDIQKALLTYRGEPHRVQTVLTSQNIEYIDDSKGTNVGATAAALKGFDERKVVIILGGDGKGQDFSPLKGPVQEHCRAVILIGRDAPLIEKVLQGVDIPMVHAKDMKEAVLACRANAFEGDVILLSPACASWDMFKDYADRSQQFIDCAKEIAEDEGTLC